MTKEEMKRVETAMEHLREAKAMVPGGEGYRRIAAAEVELQAAVTEANKAKAKR